MLLLDARRGQDIRLRSQKGINRKPEEAVEPKVPVQLRLAALPRGGAVTLDRGLGLSGTHLLFNEMRLNDMEK